LNSNNYADVDALTKACICIRRLDAILFKKTDSVSNIWQERRVVLTSSRLYLGKNAANLRIVLWARGGKGLFARSCHAPTKRGLLTYGRQFLGGVFKLVLLALRGIFW